MERIKKYAWFVLAILCIVWGTIAFVTPLTPASWLVFVGLIILFGQTRTKEWTRKILGKKLFDKLKVEKIFNGLGRFSKH